MKGIQQLSFFLIFFFKFVNRRTKYLDQYLKREGVRDIKLHFNVKFGMYSFSYDDWLL